MGEGFRIDGDDLRDDQAAAALGAFDKKVLPTLGYQIALAVIGQGCGQGRTVADCLPADLQR